MTYCHERNGDGFVCTLSLDDHGPYHIAEGSVDPIVLWKDGERDYWVEG